MLAAFSCRLVIVYSPIQGTVSSMAEEEGSLTLPTLKGATLRFMS